MAATNAVDFSWLYAMLPSLIMIVVVLAIFMGAAKATGLDKILFAWTQRQKPIIPERKDYIDVMVHNLKVAAKRHRVPSKLVFCQPRNDPEQPPAFWGKVKGVTMESDACHILVRYKWRIFHDLYWFPREKMEDVHSKELFLDCEGFKRFLKHIWIPAWGSTYSAGDRERLTEIVKTNIKANMATMQQLMIDESGVAGTAAAMEPPLRAVGGRSSRVMEEPGVVAPPQHSGEEVFE